MRPKEKDFRELRKVDDKETHERIWRPVPDPELPLAGQLKIVASPEKSLLYFLQTVLVGAALILFFGLSYQSPIALLGIGGVLLGSYLIRQVPYEFTYQFTDNNGASTEVILNGRTNQATNHTGRGCFAKVSESVCDARTKDGSLLARSVMLDDSSQNWRRFVPHVGDTFDIFLPVDITPEEAKKLMECVTFGRFQRMSADKL